MSGLREYGKGGHFWLADGRAAVTESASVDGYSFFCVYFDIARLEHADVGALDLLLHESGFSWEGRSLEVEYDLSAEVVEDAKGRPVWQFQVVYSPD
jgi:hypothetical protein